MGDCLPLLVLQEGSGDDFTVRLADMYIHALFSYPNAKGLKDLQIAFESYSTVNRVQRHRQHEAFLQRKFTGCEREVFNDASVRYPNWRPYLSGQTGTMSQLILNGYYHFYLHLVDMGLTVNAKADCQILLTQLVQTADISLFTDNDWRAIHRIFEIGASQGFQLPSKGWWQSVLTYLDEKKAATSQWEFWRNYPERRTWDSFWSWSPSSKVLPTVRPKIPIASGLSQEASYNVYEYYPFYPSFLDYPTDSWGFTSGTGAVAFERDFASAKRRFETLKQHLTGSNNVGGKRRSSSKAKSRRNKRKTRKSTL